MTIVRIRHSSNYTVIQNQAIQDSRLSFAARGLHHLLLSYPDDWVVNLEHLADQSPDKKGTIEAALTELKRCGYVQRVKAVDPQTKRIIGWETHVFELPVQEEELPPPGKATRLENPDGGNSTPLESHPPGNSRHLENRGALISTNSIPSTNSLPSTKSTKPDFVFHRRPELVPDFRDPVEFIPMTQKR